jgi:DNA-directed RNA polymerase specialized sigma24 family protein
VVTTGGRLVKFQDCRIADAASLSGQTAAVVKVDIHRGLAKLAAHVDELADAAWAI